MGGYKERITLALASRIKNNRYIYAVDRSARYTDKWIDMGNREAFTWVYREHYPALCYFVNRLVQDQSAAEDVVDELFANLYRHQSGFSDEEHLKAYLYRSAHHASLNHLRSIGNARKRESDYLQSSDAWNESVQHEIIRAESYNEIYQAILSLPPQCSKVIQAAYLQGLKNSEIAEQLGISEQTVKNHKQHGMKLLRSRIDPMILQVLTLLAGLPLYDWFAEK